jgi:hypothetical protein
MNTQEIQSQVEFLASVELLSALTRADIERLAQSAQSRPMAFGDTVCTTGEEATGVFIVKSGSCSSRATSSVRSSPPTPLRERS